MLKAQSLLAERFEFLWRNNCSDCCKGNRYCCYSTPARILRFSYLNELLMKLNEMDVKVFITMHNTRDRSIIFPSKRIEKAVEGLKTCSTVMVHTNADVENLEN